MNRFRRRRDVTPEAEGRKRRREAVTVLVLGILFLILTWVEFQLTAISQKLPFVHSVFFFGLVNFNIVLLLFLLFLVFRNVVKIFVERQGRIIGSSLKGKLVAAFVAFSLVPTVLLTLISVFYINSSFDKWFSVKMGSVLRDALEVTNTFYLNSTRKNYHFAGLVAKDVQSDNAAEIQKRLKLLVKNYSLDVIEYYPDLFSDRVLVMNEDSRLPEIPPVSLEFLQKGVKAHSESSTIHQFGEGNLIRVIVPVSGDRGAIVVSTFVALSFVSRVDEIAAAYNDFKDVNPLEYPLKSIYLILLVMMTLVILFGATWFGFHLAKQLSTPLVMLGKAARRVSRGRYAPVEVTSGSQEINQLIQSFNQMTSNLAKSEREVRQANKSLKMTLDRLDEHNRYIEVVLSNVTTGVISVDQRGLVTTINRHACKLLKVSADQFVGRKYRDALTAEQLVVFESLLTTMKRYKAHSLQKEVRFNVQGEPLTLQMTVTILKDDLKNELGMVIVFDDMSMLINAQRAAAWREVARRIAHEIKNPLTPIKLSAQRLEKKFSEQVQDPAFSECTQTIIKQVDALKEMVNEFSHFARLPQSKPTLADLNAVVESSLVLYKTGHKDTQFDVALDPQLPKFNFDTEQIGRVIGNLLENSLAAIEGQPTPKVTITTQYDNTLGIARLEVHDNGHGIPEENRERIFEPYFSTKEQGTGLGLAIVKRIIDDHSGFVRVLPAVPKGTKMIVELPTLMGHEGLVTANPTTQG
jgi:two-component system nitrogen regulation sensor histidine kinase NtrY